MINQQAVNTEKLLRLHECGQSVWLDNLTREMLHNGELKARIEDGGLRGITSNPKTFSDSVLSGTLYDEDIERLVHEGEDDESIYESLMIDDVQQACDAFEALYRDSEGSDGYVSIEVDPRLAQDEQGTLQEARKLWKKVNRPNAMVKIPATEACLPAIEEALYEGINVNITLIFSVARYRDVAACYLRAVRRRDKEGLELHALASVASFFLSRIDSKVDGYLDAASVSPGEKELAASLKGKAAIAQARAAYADYCSTCESLRWQESLQKKGALPQRLLWASTSVKDEMYPDTLYVDSLVGEGTVNTMPEGTMEAFSDRGTVSKNAIESAGEDPEELAEKLANLGIDMEAVAVELEKEGIDKFIEPFEEGLRSISRQTKQARGDAV
ncbi:transaldolase [Pelagicoccus sp. SDUM812002]|uniref:transaldolase n=1 Tax=Pelagicoccus sp. SDUM812002 TaxID=3041266 RepID=UPI00280D0C35|nr:transaldolase [Pelagicoccus sp. SDUM812002]MDQ8186213.1 transaldolase [Pelagicoccus sp. SDUM812002]